VAQRVDLSAYTLPPGTVRTALAAAARQGARVRVRLEGRPFHDPHGSLRSANLAAVTALRAVGADAALTGDGGAALHLKAAVVDGVAWLDDRNWVSGPHATLLRDDDPADVAVVRAALAGRPARDGHLATTKADAQTLELEAIRSAGGSLAVATESFGAGAISHALLERARAGRPTRLLVAGREAGSAAGRRERSVLAHLAAAGVEVRVGIRARGDVAEKLAVGDGVGWIGSANATYAGGPFGAERDWGLLCREPVAVDGLRAAFEGDWNAGRPLRP